MAHMFLFSKDNDRDTGGRWNEHELDKVNVTTDITDKRVVIVAADPWNRRLIVLDVEEAKRIQKELGEVIRFVEGGNK